jgi:RNA polymerase sigma factor (sigma-70 family)
MKNKKTNEIRIYGNLITGISYKKLKKEEIIDIVFEAKKGNELAYNKILCHLYNYICFLISKYFVHGSESQDIAQECAVKLLNIIEKYDEEKGTFDAFSKSSMEKHIKTKINEQKTQKRKILNESYSFTNEKKDEEGNDLGNFSENISEDKNVSNDTKSVNSFIYEIVQKDYEKYLLECIQRNLSDLEAKVFYLRYFEHLNYKEIAKKLSLYKTDSACNRKILNQKAVDNAIWRSRPKIKKNTSEGRA